MSKYQFSVLDFNSHTSFIELIGNILGILDEFPDPSYSGIEIFREMIQMLRQLLRELLEPSLVLRLLVLFVCKIASLHKAYFNLY